MSLPFVDHIGAQITQCRDGSSVIGLDIKPFHLNSLGIVHGGVLFTLADTGMGAALYSTLNPDERCSTIEVKINYFKPLIEGSVQCHSHILHRGKRVANLEATLTAGDELIGKASGSFAIFTNKS